MAKRKAEDNRRTWHSEVKSRIGKEFDVGEHFTIEDVYNWEEQLKRIYPANRHVRATLRDLLQQYRDEGLIKFDDWEGTYTLLEDPKSAS